jgi:uncharacterized protein
MNDSSKHSGGFDASITQNLAAVAQANSVDTDTLFTRLKASPQDIASFCQRWQVTELALFGSILRQDFNEQASDVDLLVSFIPGYSWSFDDAFEMRESLSRLFQRPVDLISKASIEQSTNWIRKQDILSSAKVIYAC